VEAIGPVRVELAVRSGSPDFDIFARVCDVDAGGASWNVCDALARVGRGHFERAADDTTRVAFELWPMAHRFAAGNRVRLQVSSGAYPRFARNPGTGEDPLTTSGLRAVDIEVLHDVKHPSFLALPASEGKA
jgi:putative CocE/NonD family hydrolase